MAFYSRDIYFNYMVLGVIFSFLALAVIIIGAIVFLFFSIIPILRGAPYVPIHKKRLDMALEFLNLKPGQKIADLGSGDGRILIELAKRGVIAIGYEINPLLVLKTKMEIKKQGLGKLAFCHWKSFWGVNFNQFDTVFIFGITHIMRAVESKAQKELKPGAVLVCFVFPLPPHQTKLWCGGEPNTPVQSPAGNEAGWQPIFAENGVYIYKK